LFVVPGEDTLEMSAEAAAAGIDAVEVSSQVLSVLTETVTPQGAVAVVESPDVSLEELPANPQTVLVLAGVSDPGNAGTLVRTAAAAGADAVVFAENSVDPLNPKVVRASAAALFLVPLVREGEVADVGSALRSRGCALLGAAASGRNVFTELDLTRPSAIFVGNEAGGLPPAVLDLMDETVAIPMPGRTESLNAGIAGSILLFEALRQRRFRY
jgi:RNA methyltransferase, TrmH family